MPPRGPEPRTGRSRCRRRSRRERSMSADGPDRAARLQRAGHRDLRGRAVRQQGRGVHRVVPGVDARATAAGRGACRARRSRASAARPGRPGSTFGVSRSRCASTIAPIAAVISRALVASKAKTYLLNSSCASPGTLPSALAAARPGHRRRATPAPTPSTTISAEEQADDGGHRPLPLDRLHDRVGRVDADEHQHEQEQHQDRAGVDDDLHREQERRVLHERTAPPGRSSRPPAASRRAPPCGRTGCRARRRP